MTPRPPIAFTINVCYDPHTGFSFTDQTGKNADPLQHVLAGDTVEWILNTKSPCKGSNLQIHGHPHPFTSHDPNPVAHRRYTVNQHHSPSYKYSVSVTYKGETKTSVDPQIMFDDGQLAGTTLLLDAIDDALPKLGAAAESAFSGLAEKLRTTDLKRDPNGLFFPGGITNISVQLTVPVALSTITIGITVSGPDSTVLNQNRT